MKSKIVPIRFRQKDYLLMKQMAESENKNVSCYIRGIILDTLPKMSKEEKWRHIQEVLRKHNLIS